MPISAVCLNCGSQIRVGEKAIGHTLPCEVCGAGIYVDNPDAAGSSSGQKRGVAVRVSTAAQTDSLFRQTRWLTVCAWFLLVTAICAGTFVAVQLARVGLSAWGAAYSVGILFAGLVQFLTLRVLCRTAEIVHDLKQRRPD